MFSKVSSGHLVLPPSVIPNVKMKSIKWSVVSGSMPASDAYRKSSEINMNLVIHMLLITKRIMSKVFVGK